MLTKVVAAALAALCLASCSAPPEEDINTKRERLFVAYRDAVEEGRQCMIRLGYDVSDIFVRVEEATVHFNVAFEGEANPSYEQDYRRCLEAGNEASVKYMAALAPVDQEERARLWEEFAECARLHGVKEDLSGLTEYEVVHVIWNTADGWASDCIHTSPGLFGQHTGVGDPEHTILSTGAAK